MTLTLTCRCGTTDEWTATTFSELRALATGLGWDIKAPSCPVHAEFEEEGPAS